MWELTHSEQTLVLLAVEVEKPVHEYAKSTHRCQLESTTSPIPCLVLQGMELVLLRPPRSQTSGFQKLQIVLLHPLIHPQPRSHESASSENVLVWLIGFHNSNRSSRTSSSHVFACTKQRGPWCETPIRRNHLDCHCRCMIRSSSPVVLRYFLHGMCTAGQPATSQLNKFRKALELQRFNGFARRVTQLGSTVGSSESPRVSQILRVPLQNLLRYQF